MGLKLRNSKRNRSKPEELEAKMARAKELLAKPFTKESVFGEVVYFGVLTREDAIWDHRTKNLFEDYPDQHYI